MDDDDDAFLYGDESAQAESTTGGLESRTQDGRHGAQQRGDVQADEDVDQAAEGVAAEGYGSGQREGDKRGRAPVEEDGNGDREEDDEDAEEEDDDGDSDSDLEIILDGSVAPQPSSGYNQKPIVPQQQQRPSSVQKPHATLAPEYMPFVRPGQSTIGGAAASLSSQKPAVIDAATNTVGPRPLLETDLRARGGGEGGDRLGEGPPPTAPSTAPRLDLDPGEQALHVGAESVEGDVGPSIYHIDPTQLDEKPWRRPGADLTDWFNYGFDEDSWRLYGEKMMNRNQDRIALLDTKREAMDNSGDRGLPGNGERSNGLSHPSMASQLGPQQMQVMHAMMGASGLSGMSPEMMMQFMGINPNSMPSLPGSNIGGNNNHNGNNSGININNNNGPSGGGGFALGMPGIFGPPHNVFGGPFSGGNMQRPPNNMPNSSFPQQQHLLGQEYGQGQGVRGGVASANGQVKGSASGQSPLWQSSASNSPMPSHGGVKKEEDGADDSGQVQGHGEDYSGPTYDDQRERESGQQHGSDSSMPLNEQDLTTASYEMAQMRSGPNNWTGRGRGTNMGVTGAPTGPSSGARSMPGSTRGGPPHVNLPSNVPTGPRNPAKRYNDRDTGAGHADSLDYGGGHGARGGVPELGYDDEASGDRRRSSRSPPYSSSSRRARDREREKGDAEQGEREGHRERRRTDDDGDEYDDTSRHRRRRGGGHLDEDLEDGASLPTVSRSGRRRRDETRSRSVSLDYDDVASGRRRGIASSRREKRDQYDTIGEEQGGEDDGDQDDDDSDGEKESDNGRERVRERERGKDRSQRRAERRAGKDSDTGASSSSTRPYRKRGAPDDVALPRESRRRK